MIRNILYWNFKCLKDSMILGEEEEEIAILSKIPPVQNRYQFYIVTFCLFLLGSDDCVKDIILLMTKPHIFRKSRVGVKCVDPKLQRINAFCLIDAIFSGNGSPLASPSPLLFRSLILGNLCNPFHLCYREQREKNSSWITVIFVWFKCLIDLRTRQAVMKAKDIQLLEILFWTIVDWMSVFIVNIEFCALLFKFTLYQV